MSSRERILAKIRRQQGRGGANASPAETQFSEAYVRQHPRGPVPELQGSLVDRFCARAQASAGTAELVGKWEEAPGAIARYLAANALPMAGCVWPALERLDWVGAGLTLAARAANGDDAIGVSGAFCAIAETGTLMMVSGPGSPPSVSLLPETHFALVSAARVVAHMEDAWDLARFELEQLPRAVNFISGPSRTADIEQTMVLGAHGPYRVHIVIVTDEPGP